MTRAAESLADRIRALASAWATAQQALVRLAADFADGHEWAMDGSPTAAHWIADVADIEVSTAREWIRAGRALRDLPAIEDAFADGRLSYSKVRALTRVATPENESELLGLALGVPAGALARTLAAWVTQDMSADDLEQRHQRQRSVKWWVEPDGMVTFSLRLPPLTAAILIAWLTAWVMKPGAGGHASADAGATVAQQHADAFAALLDSTLDVETELVLHVRGDGCTLDDGTPVPDNPVAARVPESLIRALVHDADGRPVNASGRRRHPTTRQKRVVKERDQVCVDCGRTDLLQFDHNPPYEETKRTQVDELEVRCAPCHRARHSAA